MTIDTTNKRIFIDYVKDDVSKDLEECAEYLLNDKTGDKTGWEIEISTSVIFKKFFEGLLFGDN